MSDKFCKECGAKKIEARVGGYDGETGEPRIGLMCPEMPCHDGGAHQMVIETRGPFFFPYGVRLCMHCRAEDVWYD